MNKPRFFLALLALTVAANAGTALDQRPGAEPLISTQIQKSPSLTISWHGVLYRNVDLIAAADSSATFESDRGSFTIPWAEVPPVVRQRLQDAYDKLSLTTAQDHIKQLWTETDARTLRGEFTSMVKEGIIVSCWEEVPARTPSAAQLLSAGGDLSEIPENLAPPKAYGRFLVKNYPLSKQLADGDLLCLIAHPTGEIYTGSDGTRYHVLDMKLLAGTLAP